LLVCLPAAAAADATTTVVIVISNEFVPFAFWFVIYDWLLWKKIQFNVFSSFLHPFLMVFAVKMCTLKCHHKLQDFSWQLHPSKINQHACSSRLHFFLFLSLTHSLVLFFTVHCYSMSFMLSSYPMSAFLMSWMIIYGFN
jgi:hypothetical protein